MINRGNTRFILPLLAFSTNRFCYLSRRPETMVPLVQACASPREVAEHAEVLFVMVSDTPDMEQVIFSANGVIEAIRPESVVVDMSSISPIATRDMAGGSPRKARPCSTPPFPAARSAQRTPRPRSWSAGQARSLRKRVAGLGMRNGTSKSPSRPRDELPYNGLHSGAGVALCAARQRWLGRGAGPARPCELRFLMLVIAAGLVVALTAIAIRWVNMG